MSQVLSGDGDPWGKGMRRGEGGQIWRLHSVFVYEDRSWGTRSRKGQRGEGEPWRGRL